MGTLFVVMWWVKVNTDGVVSQGDNVAIAGGVLRDWGGNWIVGFKRNAAALGELIDLLELAASQEEFAIA
ncbi:hypothetical protein PVK06_021129 [Gossypium arboreum]|uniref:RNase H type-1 domain-containing protein n=1 Tax=Gossypium arboreum TaxID=29729 RepID=A0ABR0PPC5_GOSAR|nr:hypothetical protein PVK06_021129 [Gossypium arboreum]